MRIIITRPEPDALALKVRLEAAGHEAIVEPLSAVSFDDAERVDLTEAQALIATSRNGVRALKAQRAHGVASKLPLFAVGPGTAQEARKLGFELILAGKGTARDLIPEIVANLDPHAGPLIHLAGDQLAFDLAGELTEHGFRVDAPVVYRMVQAKALSRVTLEHIVTGEADAVMLLSPRTADTWLKLVHEHKVADAAGRLRHLCLSRHVAARLRSFARPIFVDVPAGPSLDDMLALLR